MFRRISCCLALLLLAVPFSARAGAVYTGWPEQPAPDVTEVIGLAGKDGAAAAIGAPYTFRAETVCLFHATVENPALDSSHYFAKDDQRIGYFRKTSLGPDWLDFWGDYVQSRFLSGMLGQAGDYAEQVMPGIVHSNAYEFSAYLEPQAVYSLSARGQTTTKYAMQCVVDRDEDIFADDPQNAVVVDVDLGDRFRVDGKLTYLGDRHDYVAVRTLFDGNLPLTISQFKQPVDITVEEISPDGTRRPYADFSGDDMATLQKLFQVRAGHIYVFGFHNPGLADISTATYSLRFEQHYADNSATDTDFDTAGRTTHEALCGCWGGTPEAPAFVVEESEFFAIHNGMPRFLNSYALYGANPLEDASAQVQDNGRWIAFSSFGPGIDRVAYIEKMTQKQVCFRSEGTLDCYKRQ